MRKLLLTTAIAAALTMGCATGPSYDATTLAEAERLELVPVEKSRFDQTFGLERSLWIETRDVFIADLQTANTVIDKPLVDGRFRNKTWMLNEKEKAGLNKLYKKALQRQLEQQGYAVQHAPTANALVISAELLALDPTAPKDDIGGRSAFEGFVTEGAGSATIAFDVSQNDRVLLQIEDQRDAGHSWGVNNRFHNTQDVRQLFNSWTHSLLAQLDIKS